MGQEEGEESEETNGHFIGLASHKGEQQPRASQARNKEQYDDVRKNDER